MSGLPYSVRSLRAGNRRFRRAAGDWNTKCPVNQIYFSSLQVHRKPTRLELHYDGTPTRRQVGQGPPWAQPDGLPA
jgi:hypothetical protein